MAPLATNLTHRVYFDYVTGNAAGVSKEHTFMWRYNSELDPSTVIPGALQRLDAFLTAVTAGQFRQGWRFLRGRVSEAGTNFTTPFTLPVNITNFVGTNNSAGWDAVREAQEFTWQGRSPTTGRRVDFSVYGLTVGLGGDFRFTLSEGGWVAGTIAALSNTGYPALATVDGSTATWQSYVNANSNSYWERRIRLG